MTHLPTVLVVAVALIDADGRVVRAWRNVKVADHAAAVLEAARSLG